MKANAGQPRHPLIRVIPMLLLLALLMVISPVMAQEPDVTEVTEATQAPASNEESTSERNALRGRLSGRKIAINPGHGLHYNGWSWHWQRNDYWGIREDLVTPDIAKYLYDYLRAEGATVYSTRELNKNAGTGESGYPKWQEAARYYIKSQGAPRSVWDSSTSHWKDDLNARPLYANWRNTDILVSIHTNGAGGTGTETLSLIHI